MEKEVDRMQVDQAPSQGFGEARSPERLRLRAQQVHPPAEVVHVEVDVAQTVGDGGSVGGEGTVGQGR